MVLLWYEENYLQADSKLRRNRRYDYTLTEYFTSVVIYDPSVVIKNRSVH